MNEVIVTDTHVRQMLNKGEKSTRLYSSVLLERMDCKALQQVSLL